MGGFMLSVLTMFTMIGTPIVGLFSDKVGRRATIMLLGTLLLIPVFLMMAYTNVSLYVPMGMLGFAFTFVPAIIWPSVAYLVPQRTLGTALGVMTMIQNLGMTGMNWVLGRANDVAGASASNPAGYLPMMKILTVLGFIGFGLALLLRQREVGPPGMDWRRSPPARRGVSGRRTTPLCVCCPDRRVVSEPVGEQSNDMGLSPANRGPSTFCPAAHSRSDRKRRQLLILSLIPVGTNPCISQHSF